MIDFSTLQGLSIPEGVVEQIADASGRVIWMGGSRAILQVEKITSNTYAAETNYTGEQFILLDIYPKTNGTVKVTYGGLTKTITDTSGAEMPNAQQVFFGTFNGESDSVTTPSSGKLTIDGDYYSFGCSSWPKTKKDVALYAPVGCITKVVDFGKSMMFGVGAFANCAKLTSVILPSHSIASLYMFVGCSSLASVVLPDDMTGVINTGAFQGCVALANIEIPNMVSEIALGIFDGCTALASVKFNDPSGWYVTKTENGDVSTGTVVDVSNPENNAILLRDTYRTHYWYKS